MLVEAEAGGEREVGADAHEHPTPLAIEEVEVVLGRPPPFVLQMPAVVFADGDEHPRRFAGFQDDDGVIGRGPTKVRVNERVATLLGWRLENRDAPLFCASSHPVSVLRSDVAKHSFAHRIELTIGVEEPHDALWLLKRLNQGIEQDAIKAPVPEANAIFVVLVEGVHGRLQVLDNREA
jgi:hypothetical protein